MCDIILVVNLNHESHEGPRRRNIGKTAASSVPRVGDYVLLTSSDFHHPAFAVRRVVWTYFSKVMVFFDDITDFDVAHAIDNDNNWVETSPQETSTPAEQNEIAKRAANLKPAKEPEVSYVAAQTEPKSRATLRKHFTKYAVYSTWSEFVGDEENAGVLEPISLHETKKEAWATVRQETDENFSNIVLSRWKRVYHYYNVLRTRLRMKTHYPGLSSHKDCACWVQKIEYWDNVADLGDGSSEDGASEDSGSEDGEVGAPKGAQVAVV